MPSYSVGQPNDDGHLDFPFYPCYGYDAEGMDIGACVIVDTDTGRVMRPFRNSAGEIICDGYGHPEILGAREGEIPLEAVQFKPPIVFEREPRTTWRQREPLL